jgi:hypothetical protein
MYNAVVIAFVIVLFIQSSESPQDRFIKTVHELHKDGFCIKQICSANKALLATKDRSASNEVRITTFNHDILFAETYQQPVLILSGGIEGFAWKETAESATTYCYRLPTRECYTWSWDKGYLIDCLINENYDTFYYKHNIHDTSEFRIGYSKNVPDFTVLLKSISAKSAVTFLEDAFSKHHFYTTFENGKQKNDPSFVLMEKNNPTSCALIMENRYAAVFGHHRDIRKNTIAVNNANTQLCLRHGNLLQFYTPQTKDTHTIKIESPYNASTKKEEAIQYFLFCPYDKYLLIFFDSFVQVYNLKHDNCFQKELPKKFEAAHVFVPERTLVMQSIFDTFFKVIITLQTVEFAQLT